MTKISLTEPKNHDYTDQYWGHAISMITPLKKAGLFSMTGHGESIKKGHTLTMKMQSGRIGKFAVNKISYYQDPRDMWNLEATFTGYVSE